MYETTVRIGGMMCGMCEAHVCDAIRNAFPVKKASASRAKGRAVILSEEPLNESALKAALAATGYEIGAVSVRRVEEKKRGLLGLLRK